MALYAGQMKQAQVQIEISTHGQGLYEITIDVSAALEAAAPDAQTIDLTLAFVDLKGEPMDASLFHFERVAVSRRT